MSPRQLYRGAYVVSAFASGIVEVARISPPSFSAFMIRERAYAPALGTTYLGPVGECIIGLEWDAGEPAEEVAIRIIGDFEEDLADWRKWPEVGD